MTSENTRDQISDLILRVALRDRNAFDRLYTATSAKLFGTCLRVLKDRAEAEEVVQDVFIRIVCCWQERRITISPNASFTDCRRN